MSAALFEKHLPLLRQASAAIENRVYWSPFRETPANFADDVLEAGRTAFEAYRDASFYLDQPGVVGRNGAEVSPYGLPLNVSYPVCNPDGLIMAARAAMWPWVKAGPEARIGACLEMLQRLQGHGLEIAHAAMHTTGQSFNFAYDYSVIQALDRGLEAVACAYREMKQVPSHAHWTQPAAQGGTVTMDKTFTPAPRGVGLVIACSTSPTWSAFPGIFASLATGNPVMVKPHMEVVLPLAVTVAICRMTLKELGFDPNLVSLLMDDETRSVARIAALKSDVRLIDYTGGRILGDWLEENAHQAVIFSQKPCLNTVVVDSTEDYPGLLRNLASTLCLYAGQLAATPRLVLVSREGIKTPDGQVTSGQFARDLSLAISRLMEDPARAADLLGCLRSAKTVEGFALAREFGEVLRDATMIEHPQWPGARCYSPLLVRIDTLAPRQFSSQSFGPFVFLGETATTAEGLALAERLMTEEGALAFGLHSTNEHVLELAEDISLRVGVPLHLNLTANVLMNQPAAFADFYGTGANPAANCSFTDSAFIARRFFLVQSQRSAGG